MNFLRSFYSAGRRNALVMILLIAGASMSAQQGTLQVISDYSSAKVFFGTPENPTSFDVGVAKVSGEVQIRFGDIGASHFNLTIYAAKPTPSVRVNQKDYEYQSVISFQSNSVEQHEEGKLEVRGLLTVTQVFGEGGANPTRFRTSQEVTLVFSGLEQAASASDLSRGDMVPTQKTEPEPRMLVTATTSVNGEAFPALLLTIQDVAWPQIAGDESCSTSSAPEDYSGATCAGSMAPELLALRSGDPPAGNLVTIEFKLILVNTDSDYRDSITNPRVLSHSDRAA